jgi:hypothetical protein
MEADSRGAHLRGLFKFALFLLILGGATLLVEAPHSAGFVVTVMAMTVDVLLLMTILGWHMAARSRRRRAARRAGHESGEDRA